MRKFNEVKNKIGVCAVARALTENTGKEYSPQRLNNWDKRGIPPSEYFNIAETFGFDVKDFYLDHSKQA